jgi:hypothetical protein
MRLCGTSLLLCATGFTSWGVGAQHGCLQSGAHGVPPMGQAALSHNACSTPPACACLAQSPPGIQPRWEQKHQCLCVWVPGCTGCYLHLWLSVAPIVCVPAAISMHSGQALGGDVPSKHCCDNCAYVELAQQTHIMHQVKAPMHSCFCPACVLFLHVSVARDLRPA